MEGFTRRLSAAKAEAPDPRRATALPPWAAADSASVAADSAAAAAWPSVTRSSCMAPLMRTAPVCLARARWASIRSSRARFRASSNARSAAFTSVAVVVMFSSTRETGDLNPLGKNVRGRQALRPCSPACVRISQGPINVVDAMAWALTALPTTIGPGSAQKVMAR